MNHATPASIEQVVRDGIKLDGFKRDHEMDLLNARLAATGLDLTGATAPSIAVANSFARIRWAAAATAGICWSFMLRGEYAERQGSVTAARTPDEISFTLMMLGAAAPNVFAPVIHQQRAGSAIVNTITPTFVRTALTTTLLKTAAFVSATTFQLSASPSQPELVEVIFRGKGFQQGDALQFNLTPNAALNSQSDLYSIRWREWTHIGLSSDGER